jgi:ADP-glucose pyrophosphorylase
MYLRPLAIVFVFTAEVAALKLCEHLRKISGNATQHRTQRDMQCKTTSDEQLIAHSDFKEYWDKIIVVGSLGETFFHNLFRF